MPAQGLTDSQCQTCITIMGCVPPNFKLTFLQCPIAFQGLNTFLTLIHPLYTWPPAWPQQEQILPALSSPHAFRTPRRSSQLQRWPGVCSHSLALIEIPEAPGSTDNSRGKRMQNRSSEYFPEETGLLASADLAWPPERGLDVGIWLRQTELRCPKLLWKHGQVLGALLYFPHLSL